jgi:GNAT superfamily N-acetyltransferase
MTVPSIDIRRGNSQELEAFLAERLYEFNSKASGHFDGESFSAAHRDWSGTIVAGISGYTWGGCCFVSHLWVAEEHRSQGLGRALLEAAEENAKDAGCVIALLSSHSFQAPDFYERLGYEEQASIKDHPVGHMNVFFAKRI